MSKLVAQSLFASLFLIATSAATHAQKRELMAVTGSGLTSIDTYTGINDAGTVAFTGVDANGSRAFVAPTPGNWSGITFFSATRVFSGAAINNAVPADVATRDRVTGSPPIYLVRKWPENGSQAFTTIGSSPNEFDSATSYVDINDNGIVAFQALVSGSTQTALMAGILSHAPTQLAVWNGSVLIRPQISNNGKIVIRDNATRIQAWPYPGGTPDHFAGSTQGFATLGSAPGISRDGTVAAFTGDRGMGNGVFVGMPWSGGKWICRIAGEGTGPVSALVMDDRVGISSSGDTLAGLSAVIVFNGTSNSVSGVWAVGLYAIESAGAVNCSLSGVCPIVATGDVISGNTVAGCALFDPLNDKLKVGVRVSFASGASGVLRCGINPRSALPALTTPKYTQYDSSYASNCLVYTQSPPCGAGTFIQYGCTISAFTTAITKLLANNGFATAGVTPVTVEHYLFDHGRQDPTHGTVDVTNAVWEKKFGNIKVRISTKRGTTSVPFKFADIVSELQAGRPVLLCVPSMSSMATYANTLAGKKCHYILAYAYDIAVAKAFGAAAGVLVVDPGYGTGTYAQPGLAGHVPGFTGQANDPTHVSLHDYFAAMSRKSGSSLGQQVRINGNYFGAWGDTPQADDQRIQDWFDLGVINQVGGGAAQQIAQAKLKQLVTKFVFTTSPSTPAPTATVHSPVEIALTEPISGQTYVSSASIAGPNDIVLPREEPIQLDPVDVPDSNGIDFVNPPYLLELPASLYGKSLTVALHGTGAGNYTAMLHQLDDSFLPSAALTGSITNGQVVNGSFVVLPDCAASVQTYCTAKTNSLGCLPAMTASGFASATQLAPFTLSASNIINNKSGLLFYGLAQTVTAFQGGTKCVASPTKRTVIQNSGGSAGGTDCTGTYALDFNARIRSGVDAQLVPGAQVFGQYWSRDPMDAFHTNLTDAARFLICP